MMNFLLGVFATWFLLGLGYSFWWGESNLYTLLMELPARFLEIVLEVLFYPFILFYRVFLRHTLHPVSFEVMEVKAIVADSRRICGNLYFCHDKKARALRNKFFFFRIDPTMTNPNKPTSPEGGFRIGKEFCEES